MFKVRVTQAAFKMYTLPHMPAILYLPPKNNQRFPLNIAH